MALLNWGSSQHFDYRGAKPCTECGVTTPVRSHQGEPVHKVCAEAWNDDHPGSGRFHSDLPSKKKRGTGDPT